MASADDLEKGVGKQLTILGNKVYFDRYHSNSQMAFYAGNIGVLPEEHLIEGIYAKHPVKFAIQKGYRGGTNMRKYIIILESPPGFNFSSSLSPSKNFRKTKRKKYPPGLPNSLGLIICSNAKFAIRFTRMTEPLACPACTIIPPSEEFPFLLDLNKSSVDKARTRWDSVTPSASRSSLVFSTLEKREKAKANALIDWKTGSKTGVKG
jgi:hypothetical protein